MARMLIYASTGIDAPERATLAWETGVNALAAGHETVMFLAAEAVRFATEGYAESFDEGPDGEAQPTGSTLSELMERYRAGGGTLIACAESARARGITAERVVGGVELDSTARLVANLSEGFVPIYL